ncbi:hypothetical protein [Sanguibacter suaedae]|nr:hypothetical protein [Sanguibacter suaedae]
MNPALMILVVIAVLAGSVAGGYAVTRLVLALAARTSPAGGTSGDPAADSAAGPTSARAVAALRGGTWIGLLERFAITGLVLVGHPSGVALLVAVKGLGRYPELRDNPEASERFVIGTLASMVWAGGLGLLGRWLLTL